MHCVFSLEHSYLKLEEHGSSGKVIYSHFCVVWFVGLLKEGKAHSQWLFQPWGEGFAGRPKRADPR